MPFELPPVPLNIAEHARNSVIRLNQRVEADVASFISDYEDFWGVSGTLADKGFVSNGSLYTLEEMQAKVDAMPQAVAMSLLMLAGLKRDMVSAAEQFLRVAYLPDRYRTPAFTMQPLTSPSSPITLTGLAVAWQKVEETEEA